jgi:hypothetical protein
VPNRLKSISMYVGMCCQPCPEQRRRLTISTVTLNLPNAVPPVKSQTAKKTRKTKSLGLQNGESEICSSPAKLQYISNSIFRKYREVPSQYKNRYLLRGIKSGPSKAFSNAQGSGMRQRTISSSNYRVCQSSSAYQLRHAMRRMCL